MTALEKPGHIVTHVEMSPLGKVNEWHEWRGGKIATVDGRDLDWNKAHSVGDVVSLSHMRLRILDRNFAMDSYTVMQDGLQARCVGALWKAGHGIETFYHRLILTAAIWGLATYHPGAIPTWRDFKVTQRRK